MKHWQRWGLALGAAALITAGEAQARTEPFGQETVELRTARYPRAQTPRHRHRHNHAHGHRGHRHAHAHPHNDGRLHDRHDRHPEDPHFGHDHGIETEHLFGFVSGSDVHHRGAAIGMIEIVGRTGKRDGKYEAFGKKFELAYGVTGNFNAALSLSAARHRIAGVTGFDNADNSLVFNGFGGELRWNLVKRAPGSVGVTLHLEPVIQRYDELSGLRGRKYGSENKLIFDTELVKDRLFAGFNIQYEVERVLEAGETEWEKGSKLGFAFGLTGRVAPNLYLGFNAQYQRSYEGLTFGDFTGEAIFVGPTLFAKIGDRGFLSLAWNRQVWGEELGSPARLDLANFERNLFRVRAGIHF